MYCPISFKIMTDPVVTLNGDSYQREAIEKWIDVKGTCPITRNPITKNQLIPNIALRISIEKSVPELIKEQTELEIKDIEAQLLNVTPVTREYVERSHWAPIGRQINSTFASVTQIILNRNRIIPINEPIENTPEIILRGLEERNRSYSPNLQSEVRLPPSYHFIYCNCPSLRPCLINGYATVTRLNKWVELKNFIIDEESGFQFGSLTENLSNLRNEIANDYDNHSGTTMGITMRHLDYISKHGIELYEEKIRSL